MSNSKKKIAKKMSARTGLSYQASINVLDGQHAASEMPYPHPDVVHVFNNFVEMIDAVQAHVKETGATLLLHEDYRTNMVGFVTGTLNNIGGWPILFECLQDTIGPSIEALEKVDMIRASVLKNFLTTQEDRVRLARYLSGESTRTVVYVEFDDLAKMFREIRKHLALTGNSLISADLPAELKIGFRSISDPRQSSSVEVLFAIKLNRLVNRQWGALSEEGRKFIEANLGTASGRSKIASWLVLNCRD